MEELRPDITTDEIDKETLDNTDSRVIAPTETLDDRDSSDPDFRVDETLSSSNTDFGGKDPAL